MSHYHLIPIEAKQYFSLILVVFKIKLRKLCYTYGVTITINSLQKRVITGNKKPCKKQSVFKVAILRMLKLAQSAEYAQKNTVKNLPVTHVMVKRAFSSLHHTGSPRFKRPYFTKL